MLSSIAGFFDSSQFMPHGMCLLWRPDILWTQAISDAFIALAYFSIPAALIYFARHRRDFPYVWILRLFGAFIVWCGITHVIGVVTLWAPVYGIEAAVKAVTAFMSVITAIMLWPLMPKALRIPGLAELQIKNSELEREVADRLRAEASLHDLATTLERRVRERTVELTTANEQLLAAKSEAEAANRAKSVFLAGMSHELRSPLNAILGFTQLLDSVYSHGLDARQRGYLVDIQTSGSLLLEFIDRLLDLSLVESGQINVKIEATNVGTCLARACSILEPMAQKAGVQLKMTLPEPAPVIVAADATRLLQIIVNLGSNAIKYNRPRGRVDISVVVAGADEVALRISDTGVGIPAQFQEQVFQPFNRLNQEGSAVHGAGIGLALSKRLAQAMGADLTFVSIEGRGTVFELRLRPVEAA